MKRASLPLLLSIAVAPAAAAAAGEARGCLISNAEVAAVQGEPVVDAKDSLRESRSLAVSQCYYALATPARSVSLEVTRRRPGDASGPRDHWKTVFAPAVIARLGAKDAGAPLPVEGVGDAAYWVGDRVVGALYVLKGDLYFRISIGGDDEAAAKRRKSERLARAVLAGL